MSNNKPAVAMGIDYGKKNIGIAVGQTLTQSARPLAVLRYSDTKQSKKILFVQLKQLVDEWKPDVLVVGWPLNMDGSESELCNEVKKFAARLNMENNLPVAFVDERLTSREAKRNHESTDYRKYPVDSEAARILLESWLRENR
jgi:putative Holliday junction resolvase